MPSEHRWQRLYRCEAPGRGQVHFKLRLRQMWSGQTGASVPSTSRRAPDGSQHSLYLQQKPGSHRLQCWDVCACASCAGMQRRRLRRRQDKKLLSNSTRPAGCRPCQRMQGKAVSLFSLVREELNSNVHSMTSLAAQLLSGHHPLVEVFVPVVLASDRHGVASHKTRHQGKAIGSVDTGFSPRRPKHAWTGPGRA